MKEVSIFDYVDYRSFLKAYYEWQKTVSAHFSYRYFMQKAGYNSSGLYSGIVKGETNLTEKLVQKFACAMKLTHKEQDFMMLMVQYQRAQSNDAKQIVYDKMILLIPGKSRRVKAEQKRYYSKWYYVAIREALSIMNIDDNFKDLAQYLTPNLKVSEVKKALGTLKELGMIEKKNDGFWKVVDTSIVSGGELGPHIIHEFQKEMMNVAKESLGRYPKTERHVTTKTFSISTEGYMRLTQKIVGFHKEIKEILRTDVNEKHVYQFNMQLFPLAKGTND